jgi:hypothetical protein
MELATTVSHGCVDVVLGYLGDTRVLSSGKLYLDAPKEIELQIGVRNYKRFAVARVVIARTGC